MSAYSNRVRPKKSLGQHFLTDMSIAGRIAETLLPADRPDLCRLPVLEVGPGTGVLTQFILRQDRQLKAVELDSESVEYLRTNYPSLDLIEADFLKMPLDDIFPGQFALTGNYPYNISSQIFFRLLEYKERIPLCTGMLQREVAQRICAAPGGKDRGILSVLLQAWYDCEYLFTVDEHVFNPPPKVKSGVIRLIRNDVTDLGCDAALFRRVVKTTFGMRRKTLRNSVGSMVGKDSPILADPIMTKRPEQLSVSEFVALTNLVASSR